VFSNIAKSIGIDTEKYESRYNLIDEGLLNKRNYIAHGEYLDVDSDGFRNLADEILHLLRLYKTDIENAASLAAYKKSA
ncbi:TPA: MAE_28990/MAE_18760 family HEPN-like nuclease, partial [Vibrio cholerae]